MEHPFKYIEGINSQTGTAYTPVIADIGKVIDQDNVAGITTTIPPNSSVDYPVNTVLFFRQKGAGVVTLAPGSGVTFSAFGGLKTAGQYAGIGAIKMGTDLWWIIGGVA